MKLFCKKDIVIIFIIFAVACMLFFFFKTRDGGNVFVVSVDSQTVVKESIYKKGRFELDNGVVIVCDGKSVYFEESDCKDKLCIGMGHLSHSGDWAACLPNKTFLKVLE